eukprot:702909-Amphidinium_carterae.1
MWRLLTQTLPAAAFSDSNSSLPKKYTPHRARDAATMSLKATQKQPTAGINLVILDTEAVGN